MATTMNLKTIFGTEPTDGATGGGPKSRDDGAASPGEEPASGDAVGAADANVTASGNEDAVEQDGGSPAVAEAGIGAADGESSAAIEAGIGATDGGTPAPDDPPSSKVESAHGARNSQPTASNGGSGGEGASTGSETTSKVAAEAEQGTGPAAASATTSATGNGETKVSSVTVVVGEFGASAASDVGVVAVGPNGAAAANEVGVVAVGPEGGASASGAANSTDVSMKDGGAHVRETPAEERDES